MNQQVQTLLWAHDNLRRDLAALGEALAVLTEEDGVEPVRALVDGLTMKQHAWRVRAFCDRYCRIVQMHHTIEDLDLFPSLRRLDPSLAPVLDELAEDHHTLAGLLDDLDAALSSAAAAPRETAARQRTQDAIALLSQHLDAHLRREEVVIIPALTRLGH